MVVKELGGKEESGPRPAQAVPSFKSLAAKLAVIASCKSTLCDFAKINQLRRRLLFRSECRSDETQ